MRGGGQAHCCCNCSVRGRARTHRLRLTYLLPQRYTYLSPVQLRRPRVTHIHSPRAFHFISKWPNAATPGHWQARARGSCEQRPLCTSAALTAASCDSARALATRRVHGKSNRPMSTRRLADQLGSQTRMNRYKISIPMHTTLTRRPLATAIEQHPVSK